ncbi:DUF5753 domain-containing protein [Streptomyces hirsutus]|uniref:DUF5753 domain-containing protein n=2 Tax=Streptomyces hirsutus TaxID=35620 RepID=UPI0033EBE4DE
MGDRFGRGPGLGLGHGAGFGYGHGARLLVRAAVSLPRLHGGRAVRFRRGRGRMKRQERLEGSEPLQLYAVIWEAALRQQVGGPDVMRAQLHRILELAQLPNVRLQVLPFHTGGHACMAGAFSIVSFVEPEAVDVVHVDTIAATVWVEDGVESATYSAFFDRTARLSLAPRDSLRLIESISEDTQ